MKKLYIILTLLILSVTLSSCVEYYKYDETKINITTTTNIMQDLSNVIGGDLVNVYSLMGSGVDPHQYVARPHDYNALNKADIIIVSGLHLEGKMTSILESYSNQGRNVLLVGETIIKNSPTEIVNLLIKDESFGNNYDPHFWFDIELYSEAARYIMEYLSKYDTDNKEYYLNNYNKYLLELTKLNNDILDLLTIIAIEDRHLISAHDAFAYFGNKYEFNVFSLQGLSTEDQVSPYDIKEIVDLVVEHNIKAIFPEQSVPNETIKSVSEETKKRGHEVYLGNNLYSDSLGSNDDDNTYIKMYMKNITNIVEALSKGANV